MKSKVKMFIILFVCSFLVVFLIKQSDVSASVEQQVDSRIISITKKLDKEVELKTELSKSSNPYDYIVNNTDFNEILLLGNNALPILQKKIDQSPNDGLQEYILAIAIERISKTDLKKQESTQWDTPKSFNTTWENHLKTIPTAVKSISSDINLNTDEKVVQLVELGTPAMPFILEEVESVDSNLFQALVILSNNNNSSLNKDAIDFKEWTSIHKEELEILKQYVLEQ
ncbi:hypothetical protein [Paenibacillus gorillae]|uniref:hypothetical protein n=1 Tax=Paenibacillus gorillae TaxID=1243662 RepID=UPI0004B4AE94|nr:hypothetical protein [Paenibacillus gorillae]